MYAGKTDVVNDVGVLDEIGNALEVFFRIIFVDCGEIVAALAFVDDKFLLLKRFLPRKMCVVNLVDACVVVSLGRTVGNECV